MSSKENLFTFKWIIDYFDLCPYKQGEPMHSPVFLVDILQSTAWRLVLYPRGKKRYGIPMICYLQRMTAKEFSHRTITIDVSVSMSVGDEEFESLRETASFKINELIWQCAVNRKNETEVEKSLTSVIKIQCNMWKTDKTGSISDIQASAIPSLFPEIGDIANSNLYKRINAACREKVHDIKKHQLPHEFFVRTCFQLERRSASFSIPRFSKMQKTERHFVVVPSIVGNPTLFVDFGLMDENRIQFCIHRSSLETPMGVYSKITATSQETEEEASIRGLHFFETNKKVPWTMSQYFMHNAVLAKKDEFLKEDVLHLNCEFAIAYKGRESHIMGTVHYPEYPTQIDSHPSVNVDGLISVFEDRKFCDVKLNVGEISFAAHKAILASGSPVFDAMFDSDMKEKRSGEVDITDVDPETLERVLKSMYATTPQLEGMPVNDVMSLYTAADKYQISKLMKECSKFLTSNILDDNACAILRLADSHQDKKLKNAAVTYIATHSRLIFQTNGTVSEEWSNFIVENPKLAAEVVHQLLKKP